MIEILAQVQAPGFAAGIVLWDDKVVEAAPILRYMRKGVWSRKRVREYCKDRGWKVVVIHQLERTRP